VSSGIALRELVQTHVVPRLNNEHIPLSREKVCDYLKCMLLAVKTTRGLNVVRDLGVTSTLLPVLKITANNAFKPSKECECVRVRCTDPGENPVHFPPECLPQELDWVSKLSTAARAGGWTVVDCDAAFGITPKEGSDVFRMLEDLGVTPFVVPRKVSSKIRLSISRPLT
jgi:hypothetical protein